MPITRARDRRLLAASATFVLAALCVAQGSVYRTLPHMLPRHFDSTNAVAFGDVDGDQDVDAVIGNAAQNRLYFNDGGLGYFVDATEGRMPIQSDVTTALALLDIDGDGDLDLVVANSKASNRLYLNDGTGVFTDASTRLPEEQHETNGIAAGDVDGDGDPDLVLANGWPRAQFNRLYLNVDGTFVDATESRLPASMDVTRAVALGDADGDGDLDLFFGNGSPGSTGRPNQLLLNDGAGQFSDASNQLPANFGNTSSIALGDLDGDGDLDALIGNEASLGEQNRIYRNDGTGTFVDVTSSNFPLFPDATLAVQLADIDGDGSLDAIVANTNVYRNRLYLNNGSGVFADVTDTDLPIDVDANTSIAVADVDGDHDVDILFGNAQTYAENRLYLNRGGQFTDVTAPSVPYDFDWTQALATGDVDGDGHVDLLVGNQVWQNQLYLNDGSGGFVSRSGRLPPEQTRTHSAALADVDGDLDLDIMLGTQYANRLYENDGTGRFINRSSGRFPAISSFSLGVAVGDIDGDGDVDALFANNGTQNNLYLNDGAGTFIDGTSRLPSDTDGTAAVALADLDGDGDLDALMGNSLQDRLYLNDGTGLFTDVTASQLPADSDWTFAVALGDVDGDGDLDALIGNFGDPDRLYLNDGSGIFTDSTGHLPSGAHQTDSVALGDVDGDGDLDALLGIFSDRNRLYLNDGSGVFTDTSFPVDIDSTSAVALADVDGDGDLDALLGNDGSARTRVHTNLTRQLIWRSVPSVGRPLTMDLYGEAGGSWVLFLSAGTARIPTPIGTLLLDPATTAGVDSGSFDPNGRAATTLAIPPIAAWIGLPLYWQALAGPPLRLTNLEVTTLTGLSTIGQ